MNFFIKSGRGVVILKKIKISLVAQQGNLLNLLLQLPIQWVKSQFALQHSLSIDFFKLKTSCNFNVYQSDLNCDLHLK